MFFIEAQISVFYVVDLIDDKETKIRNSFSAGLVG